MFILMGCEAIVAVWLCVCGFIKPSGQAVNGSLGYMLVSGVGPCGWRDWTKLCKVASGLRASSVNASEGQG